MPPRPAHLLRRPVLTPTWSERIRIVRVRAVLGAGDHGEPGVEREATWETGATSEPGEARRIASEVGVRRVETRRFFAAVGEWTAGAGADDLARRRLLVERLGDAAGEVYRVVRVEAWGEAYVVLDGEREARLPGGGA